ncbi:MAG: imidazole glycerol phosphate synthase subunit HisH [Clostridia bacterium]|nr:imidazole glycerol phosphate synthase subunit HisH [Clostridia bacterium]
MIAIIDYGCGNLFSLSRSLEYLGIESKITSDADEIANADKIILPGVGAFGDAIDKLNACGHADLLCSLASQGKPILGICLGMQLLFEKSYEYGEHNGLGLLKGGIYPLDKDIKNLKVPHMGWNRLDIVRDDRILDDNGKNDYFYFVHSFYAKNCDDCLIATAEYGVDVPAIVGTGNVYGTQFHPEKSGDKGLKLLKRFATM